MYFMSDPQALHVTRNVIPGKLGVDLHLHRVHIPLVYFHFVSPNIVYSLYCYEARLYALHNAFFSLKFFLRSSAPPFLFVKIQNPNQKPGFDLVQTQNPGLEKDVRVWNP